MNIFLFNFSGHPSGDPDHSDYVPSIFAHTQKSKIESSASKLKRFTAAKRRQARQKKVFSQWDDQDDSETDDADETTDQGNSETDDAEESVMYAASETGPAEWTENACNIEQSQEDSIRIEMHHLRQECDMALAECVKLRNIIVNLSACDFLQHVLLTMTASVSSTLDLGGSCFLKCFNIWRDFAPEGVICPRLTSSF